MSNQKIELAKLNSMKLQILKLERKNAKTHEYSEEEIKIEIKNIIIRESDSNK